MSRERNQAPHDASVIVWEEHILQETTRSLRKTKTIAEVYRDPVVKYLVCPPKPGFPNIVSTCKLRTCPREEKAPSEKLSVERWLTRCCCPCVVLERLLLRTLNTLTSLNTEVRPALFFVFPAFLDKRADSPHEPLNTTIVENNRQKTSSRSMSVSPLVKVARLQSEFCTKYVLSYEFSYEKCSEIYLFFSLDFVVKKIPTKIPTKFPCEKLKKNHRRASAGAQGETLAPLQPHH